MRRPVFQLLFACAAWAPLSLAGAESAGIVVISEIQYHPAGGGQELESIELFNNTPAPIDISGWYFSRGVSFSFPPGTFLRGREHIVVCADVERVRAEYGISNAVGSWGPAPGAPDAGGHALDNGGETIELCESNGVPHARVRYDDRGQWPSAADGTGHSLEILDTYGEQDDPDNWASSPRPGGSPGRPNEAGEGDREPVLINEAILWMQGARWIELFNAGGSPLDVSGYRVCTERSLSGGAVIPEGAAIPSRGWRVLTEDELGLDLAAALDLAGAGDPSAPGSWFIALVAPDGSRVVDARIFTPRIPERGEARIPDGGLRFCDAALPTPGSSNRTGAEEHIVIHEIHYHPIDDSVDTEFIELYNRGDRAVDLGDWKLSDGVRFRIPPGTSLEPGEYLVIARSPDALREIHGLPADRVVGPDSGDTDAIEEFGRLSNDGERIELVDADGRIVDAVRYHDGGDWPAWCDGGGSSLELIDPWQDNAVAAAWGSSDDSAKASSQRLEYEAYFGGGEPELHLALLDRGIALVDDLEVRERRVSVEVRRPLVPWGAEWRCFKVTEPPSSPPGAWLEAEYDDGDWIVGAAPFGYGYAGTATTLGDMRGRYPSVCLRKAFHVDDPADVTGLVLEVEYDDGFAAYINGTRVAERNLADGEHSVDSLARMHIAKAPEAIPLDDARGLLAPGTNVLAVVAHNASLASSDLYLDARLVDGTVIREDGPDLVTGGDFEEPLSLGDMGVGGWLIEGTHIRSGRSSVEPISGAASLKVVATGKGDNKVNRIETGLPPLQTDRRYAISLVARWIVGSPGLLTHGYNGYDLARSHRLAVPRALGTPGAVNSASLARIAATGRWNLGPVLHSPHQEPAAPAPGEAVEVSVRAADSDGVESVTLHWSLDAPAPIGSPRLEAIPMTGPDHRGRYRATVPGQAAGARVVLFVVAVDREGHAGRYPVSPLARTHPLVLDPARASLADESYWVYGHALPRGSGELSYRLWLDRPTEEYLDQRRLHSQDPVYGTLVFADRDVYPRTRVRFAGSPYARAAWTGSYRVSLPKDRPLWGSIKRFNLEQHQGGGATDGRERISSYLIRHNQGGTRVPFLYQWLVRWSIAGRVDEPREHVAVPDGELLERWYPGDDDGPLFEMNIRHTFNDAGGNDTSQDARLVYPPFARAGMEPADKEQYRWFFSLRRDEGRDDYGALIDLAGLMTRSVTPDDEFDERVWREVNVEELLRVWAIRLNTDDWDSWGARRGKNCYLYRPSRDGRWVMLPWDMELTCDSITAFLPPAISQRYPNMFDEVDRLLNRPRVKRLYYGILKEMVDYQFRSSFLEPYMDELERAGVERTDIGRPGGYIDQRRALLAERLHDAVFPQVRLEITTGDGEPFQTDRSEIVLEGWAPVEVFSILVLVDGVEMSLDDDFSREDCFSFRRPLTLTPGTHTVTVVGFGSRGNAVDSDSVEVTVTPPAAPRFVRGDVDASEGIAVTDAVRVLLHLFRAGFLPCSDAADVDDDGRVDLVDALGILDYLFLAGAPPRPPFPEAGPDPSEDDLDCGAGAQ